MRLGTRRARTLHYRALHETHLTADFAPLEAHVYDLGLGKP